MKRQLFAMTVLTSMVVSSAALSQSHDDNWSRCDNDPNPDIRIGACTAVIQSGQQGYLAAALQRRGDTYDGKGELDRAIHDYSQLIRLNPNFPPAFYDRANEFAKEGRYDRAIQDDNQAIRLQSDYFKAYNNRCMIRAIIGDLRHALADCNQALRLALRLAPDSAGHIHDSRGFVYLKMKNAAAAIADYDEALRFDPTLASSLYGRGLAKHFRGDKDGGDADVAAAKKLQSNIAEQFVKWNVSER